MQRDPLGVLSDCAEQLGYLTPIESGPTPAASTMELVVAVDFSGACRGVIYLGMGPGLARQLAINMLGCPERSPIAEETACEAAQELVNVVAGNVLPLVYGGDAEFRIGAPRRASFPEGANRCSAALRTEEGMLALVVVGEAVAAQPIAGGR
ncbi:MAG: chemotaxis protein CheX [Planctomycetes bacterium]|nr:chemotaxis protein CheX [Planctomycetota bacterium]